MTTKKKRRKPAEPIKDNWNPYRDSAEIERLANRAPDPMRTLCDLTSAQRTVMKIMKRIEKLKRSMSQAEWEFDSKIRASNRELVYAEDELAKVETLIGIW